MQNYVKINGQNVPIEIKNKILNNTPVFLSIPNNSAATLLAQNDNRRKAVIYSTQDIYIKINNATIAFCKSFDTYVIDYSTGEISVYNNSGSPASVTYMEDIYN